MIRPALEVADIFRVTPCWQNVGEGEAELKKSTGTLVGKSFRVLGTCIKEAPEFAARKRRVRK